MDIRSGRFWLVVSLLGLLIAGGYYWIGDERLSEAATAIDNVADEVTGNRAVHQGLEVKKQLKGITDRQARQREEVGRELEER